MAQTSALRSPASVAPSALPKLVFKRGSTSTRLHLVRMTDATGHRAFYFLDVPPLRAPALRHTLKHAESVDLREFGDILASGYGEEVPAPILAQMREEYGWAA